MRTGVTSRFSLLGWLAAVAGVMLVLAVYMARIAPVWLRVRRLRVAVPALPGDWVGVRIAHLSDFHAGGAVRGELLHRARTVAASFKPDIIALTGDYYDEGMVAETDGLYRPWRGDVLVFGVLGNHDYRGGSERLAEIVAEQEHSGVRVLRNSAEEINLRGQTVWIVGVDDPHTFAADTSAAFDALPADAEALLYLAHSPAAAETLPHGRARLMLTGHTHGGQLRVMPSGAVPFVRPLRWLMGEPHRNDPPFHRGFRWINGTLVIVSGGLGLSRLPMRFRTRPEVLLIELAAAQGHGAACDAPQRYVEELTRESWLTRFLS